MTDWFDDISCFSVKHIADTCGVDLTTARRWKRRAQRPPPWAFPLLMGDLGFFDPAWKGWRLVRGELVSPENWRITLGDVLAQRLVAAQIAAYQTENRRLKAELAEAKVQQLEEQPTPDELGEIQIRIG
jgi:hypothetical protein